MQSDQVMERIIQIDSEICTGCGSCIEACSSGAIHLVDHQAEIDDDLCIRCEACLDACANRAITAVVTPISLAATASRSVTDSQLMHSLQPAEVLESIEPELGIKPYISSALAFLGSEVAPRLLDLLMKTIEKRLAQPTVNAISTTEIPSTSYGDQRKGQRKHLRYRGGKLKNGKHKRNR
jgi:NAD-dependent dihydropyrimidine dehydrogenase PreA subunit